MRGFPQQCRGNIHTALATGRPSAILAPFAKVSAPPAPFRNVSSIFYAIAVAEQPDRHFVDFRATRHRFRLGAARRSATRICRLAAGWRARRSAHHALRRNLRDALRPCELPASIEPKTGRRLAQVYDRRRKREHALLLKELAAQYPEVEKIRLAQDCLVHAQRKFVVRNISGGRSLCARATLRVLLHAEESLMTQHAGDRVVGPRPRVFA